jgi:hypothetical protein
VQETLVSDLFRPSRELCAADSAGIRVEEVGDVQRNFRWVAISCKHALFQNGILPYDFAPMRFAWLAGDLNSFV